MKLINICLYALIIVALLVSCNNRRKGEKKPTLLSNLVSITDNEDKGIKHILEYYNGSCKYSVGRSNGKRFFELELSQSDKLEKYAQRAELLASNMAFLFYRNLNEELKKYDEIHTVLVFNDGVRLDASYSLDTLNIVKTKYEILQRAVDRIAQNDFKGLESLLDDSIPIAAKKDLLTNLQKYQPMLGSIRELMPYGFKFYQASDGANVLHLSGVMLREKQNNEISINISPVIGQDAIWMLNYKL